MTFDEYEEQAVKFDVFFDTEDKSPNSNAFLSKVFGIVGESGEFADKIKKIYRDGGGVMDDDKKAELRKELADIMWYVCVMNCYMGGTLEELAQSNIEKLSSRKERNLIHGKGDNR